MRSKRFMYGAGAALLVAVSLGAATLAFGQEEQPTAAIPPAQAHQVALAAVPGTVLETELEREDGRSVYEVEVRPQAGGRVVEVIVDATTGAVLGTEVDDDDDEGLLGDLGELFRGDDR